MIETFNRQQVDNIVAPWLNLCKEQEERIEELEKALDKEKFTDVENMLDERIAELEKELKWLQRQHVRVCSNEDKLRKLAQAAVDANKPGQLGKVYRAIDALAAALKED